LTIAVDRLVHAGYVRRSADSADRRRVLVQLTRKADRVIALFADLASATDRMLDSYSEADVQLLTNFLCAAGDELANQARAVSAGRRRELRVVSSTANQASTSSAGGLMSSEFPPAVPGRGM
jgi:DNA-binding MarR family transcriptional regulator